MNKIITILLLIPIRLMAQIPNAGLENWVLINGCEEPTGWVTNNLAPWSISVEKTNDRWIDEWGMRVRSNNNIGFEGPMPGIVSTKFLFAGEYNRLSFYYKVVSALPPAYAEIAIYEKLLNGSFNLLAKADFTETDCIWHYMSLPFYVSMSTDSLKIVISANTVSSGTYFQGYSEWIIDDLKLKYTDVGVKEPSADKVLINPNPAKDDFTLSIPSSWINLSTDLIIIDNTGRKVMSRKIETSTSVINVASLSTGLYIVMLSNNQFQLSMKLVILKE
ncbi:MAG TPA: T9SS type A sorting domain-containing protein [Bacteroidales bacterium]|nr:T9SS type A sorting domain-containing protein [Bacteroidales bacterium]HPT02167.1 T9SS type A sorting domain-containing protein [Bacteroidales bacterium]